MPDSVIKTKKALGELNGPGQIEVLVDNEDGGPQCDEDGGKLGR